MKEELLKTVTEFRDGLGKESPYMATAFVNALEKMGKEGGDAMMNAVTNALKEKKEAPVDILTGAIKEGLIKGPALKEAMGIIKKRAEEMAEEASKAVEAQFSGYSPELLKALKIFQSSNALGQVGIETKFKPVTPGASVKNISNPVSVQIGTVNVGKPEDAKKT
ncbi:MAG: phage tail tape measure protein, partial [Dethiosulfovibrio sp.]|nr:phage tail tape measure protein [Dethiosulfovibrio sp.]